MATVAVTGENIEKLIDENDIVILDFWAEWCGPCRNFGPVFEAASEKHEDVLFGKVDTETERALWSSLGFSSIPLVMVFREQVMIYAQPGALPPPALEQLLTQVKDLDMEEVRAKLDEQDN